MKIERTGHRTLLINDDGSINAPFTIFLNDQFDNSNTRESVAAALKVFHRFLAAYDIDLVQRALEGECLLAVECGRLADLSYRQMDELQEMSDAMVRRISSSSADLPPSLRKGAVEPNTAARRLDNIAAFLAWFRTSILDERIRSAATRNDLRERYQATVERLKDEIGGTKEGHHQQIQSLPIERFKAVIKEIFLHPEALFESASGKPSPTLMRDRAMALLACEGLRPGFIANVTIDDYRRSTNSADYYLALTSNLAKRRKRITASTPQQKGMTSTSQNYNSEVVIKLWPFTRDAIQQYLEKERAALTDKYMRNRSKSFLFLAEHGGPIGSRNTLTAVFTKLANRLADTGLLDVTSDPYVTEKKYAFYAYVLRHSAATLFYHEKRHQPDVEDQMRARFGWTQKSKMPQRYAARALSDASSVDMMEFYESLVLEAKKRGAS